MLFKQDLKRLGKKVQITKYSIKLHWVSLWYAHQNSYFLLLLHNLSSPRLYVPTVYKFVHIINYFLNENRTLMKRYKPKVQ